MPGVHRTELVGQEVIAADLGVTSQAISIWFARAEIASPDSHLKKLPVPTLVQYTPGKKPLKVWRQAQRQVWVKWHEKHLAEQGVHIPKKQQRV